MKNLRSGLVLWCRLGVAIPALVSCGGDPSWSDPELGSHAQNFEVWNQAEDYLISQVRSGSTIRVCLTAPAAQVATYQGYIRDAIMAWVDGARPAATATLIGVGAIS